MHCECERNLHLSPCVSLQASPNFLSPVGCIIHPIVSVSFRFASLPVLSVWVNWSAILLESFDVLIGDASTKSLNMKLIVVGNVSVWSAAACFSPY